MNISYFKSVIPGLFLAGSYSILFLSMEMEDNILNLFFVMIFFIALLNQLGFINILKDKQKSIIFTGISFGLAVLTHIESFLIFPALLSIFLFKKRARELVKTLFFCFLFSSPVLLVESFSSDFFQISYFSDPELWFFSENAPHNNWGLRINHGFYSTFFGYNNFISLDLIVVLNIIITAFLIIFILVSYKSRVTQIMLLSIVLLVVHSLFYEPGANERWVIMLAPLSIIIGESAKKRIKLWFIKGISFRFDIFIMSFICFLLVFNVYSIFEKTHFNDSIFFSFINEINSIASENDVLILGFNSFSETNLYAKYGFEGEIAYSFEIHNLTEFINHKLSENKHVYLAFINSELIKDYEFRNIKISGVNTYYISS